METKTFVWLSHFQKSDSFLRWNIKTESLDDSDFICDLQLHKNRIIPLTHMQGIDSYDDRKNINDIIPWIFE